MLAPAGGRYVRMSEFEDDNVVLHFPAQGIHSFMGDSPKYGMRYFFRLRIL